MDTTENHPARLYKCGETGTTIVQHKHTKILESKASIRCLLFNPQNGYLLWQSSPTRISPTGHVIPLLLVIYKKMKQELMNDTPPGSIHACHPSGWIQSEIFFSSGSFHQTYKADKRRSFRCKITNKCVEELVGFINVFQNYPNMFRQAVAFFRGS
jgi:hypothetical protein